MPKHTSAIVKSLNITQTQAMLVILRRIEKQANLIAEERPTNWYVTDTKRYVTPLLKKHTGNRDLMQLTQVQVDEIGCLAQDAVSYRAGPTDRTERCFFRIMDIRFDDKDGE